MKKIPFIVPIVLAMLLMSADLSFAEESLSEWNRNKEQYFQRSDKLLELIKSATNNGPAYDPERDLTRVLDSHDRTIAECLPIGRLISGPRKISAYIMYAVISMEDSSFWSHKGIDPKGILRAVVHNFKSGKLTEGGSTLTQQLAKILFTGGQRTVSRKMIDMAAALELEKRYSKEDILLLYLNSVYFGHAVYGVEAASRFYFDTPAVNLGPAEAALLAGILSNPNGYSPYRNPEACRRKQRQALERMAQEGYIAKDSVDVMLAVFWKKHETLYTRQGYSPNRARVNKAPYLTDLVLQQVKEPEQQSNVIQTSYQVETYFDLARQEILQTNMMTYLHSITDPTNIMQTSVVVMDPATGKVLASVGGRVYSRENQLNRAVQMRRQVGSLIKPFLYSAAMDADPGLTNLSFVTDRAVVVPIKRQKSWRPSNYDGVYAGPMTLESALKQSKNTVAVQLLANRVGATQFANRLRKIWGRDVIAKGNELMSLALGTLELTPLQVAQGYCMLARGGTTVQAAMIREIMTNRTTYTDGQGLRGQLLALKYSFMTQGEMDSMGLDAPDRDFDPFEGSGQIHPVLVGTNNDFFVQDNGADSLTVAETNEDFVETPDDEDYSAWGRGLFLPSLIIDRNTHDTMVLSAETEEKRLEAIRIASNEMLDPDRVFHSRTIERVGQMLTGVIRKGGTAEYAAANERFTNTLSCKTGTTSDNKDAWFAAYSPELVVVVWFGYDNNTKLSMGGPGLAAPIGLRLWKAMQEKGSMKKETKRMK